MFISKKLLDRRTVLRGVGTTVALPLLDAMVPAATALAKTAARPTPRFGAVYVPNGAIMGSTLFADLWTPRATGAGFEFSPILKPLERLRNHVVVVSNLDRAGGPENDAHAPAAAGWLSGAVAKRTEAEDVRVGTTIDQVVAKAIGQDTPFPSLEVATENFTGYVGSCSTGYSCAYLNTLSWATPTTPLPTEIDPRVLFERLFGRAGTAAQRRARLEADRSILDSIEAEVRGLERDLGNRDRARLAEYLDHVREIERRIQQAEHESTAATVSIDAPIGVPETHQAHAELLFDLLKVAWEANLTRVFCFMMARELSNRAYPDLGITEGHHEVSHHGNKPEQIAKHAKINTYHSQLFANFLEKLRATPDGDGSLLDHALIVYGSGMGNGNVHSGSPLPLIAAGGGAGKGGRHIAATPHTPIGNLWLGIANTFEPQPRERFGESTGVFELA
jgi:hypothetical protein